MKANQIFARAYRTTTLYVTLNLVIKIDRRGRDVPVSECAPVLLVDLHDARYILAESIRDGMYISMCLKLSGAN